MDKILEVKNLKISFRTSSGTLKAVRDISFDLYRGKTLAIVGESGSGKSVTSKAILGILAGNSIIEGGEILYDGKDLLKLDEEFMHSIRGDKISMIFQDPLSSLNPIVKIGSQITEAMMLKNKTGRSDSKKVFNSVLTELGKNMKNAHPEQAAHIDEMIKTFDKFTIEGNKLEDSYNRSEANASSLTEDITDFLYMVSKKQKQDVKGLLKEQISLLKRIEDKFFTKNYTDRLEEAKAKLIAAKQQYRYDANNPGNVNEDLIVAEENTEKLVDEMLTQERPNFFRIGYYQMCNPQENLLSYDVNELNEKSLKVLDDNFMNEFLELGKDAIEYSYKLSLANKQIVIDSFTSAKEYFSSTFDKKGSYELLKKLSGEVKNSIDWLQTDKDPYAYTFDTTLKAALDKYFYYLVNNDKEKSRFAKQTAKRDELIAKGKTIDWKVVPMNVLDLNELKGNIIKILDNIIVRYQGSIANKQDVDFKKAIIALVDYLKDKASKAVYVVTNQMARKKAIQLMDEVGMPEPRMRFNQYPFEFSGGMRQRIVIAIALAANPEVLICDEPTTALDVTIQAQILELINKLKAERNLSIIFITHDLGVVAQMADEIAVMYAGKIVETGTTDDIFYDPRHPYTWALLSSMPDLDTKEKLEAIPGTPPNMIYPPVGDAFAQRNKYAMEIDFEQQPPMFEISETHKAATWLLHPNAPKVEKPKIITDRINRMLAKAKEAKHE